MGTLKPSVALFPGLRAVEAEVATQEFDLLEGLAGVRLHLGPAAVHEPYEAVDVSWRYEDSPQPAVPTELRDRVIESPRGFLHEQNVEFPPR